MSLHDEPLTKKIKTSDGMDKNIGEKLECKENIQVNDNEDEAEKSECKENGRLNDNDDKKGKSECKENLQLDDNKGEGEECKENGRLNDNDDKKVKYECKENLLLDDNKGEGEECKENGRLNDNDDKKGKYECKENLQSDDNKGEREECKENLRLNGSEDEEENLLSNIDEDEDLPPFPPDYDVAEMVEHVHYNGLFPTITDRYFTAYYKLNVQSPADDICILMHSNRICMLTLASSHAVLQNNKEITGINFKVSQKLDRVMNKVSGKGKHGAQPLQANSNICIITSSSGETYTIKCCIIGKLVEVNEALLENPKLLLEPPHKGGYLAIVLPNIRLLETMKKSLLTQEQYDSEMLERQNAMNHFKIKIKSEPEA